MLNCVNSPVNHFFKHATIVILAFFFTFHVFLSLNHSPTKLFDRISSQVMSPSRAPPGDAINRCREAVDSIQSATSHKYSRDRVELVHLLGSPHIQVSDDMRNCTTFRLEHRKKECFLSSHITQHTGVEVVVNQTINNLELWEGNNKNVKNDSLRFVFASSYLFPSSLVPFSSEKIVRCIKEVNLLRVSTLYLLYNVMSVIGLLKLSFQWERKSFKSLNFLKL